jgi:hypothetical protein
MLTFLSTGDKLAARALRAARRSTGQLGQLARMTGAVVKSEVSESNTGDWRFDSDAHLVRLGNRFHTNIRKRPFGSRGSFLRANDRHAVKFGAQILRHEKWHGLATVRDVPALAAACRADGVPFAVLNVLEDIRIEFKAWTVEGSWFEWTQWFDTRPATTALHAILNLKMSESAVPWAAKWHGASEDDMTDLLVFFHKARVASDSWEIVKLAKEFVARFGAPPQPEDIIKEGWMHGDIGEENDGSAGDVATTGAAVPDAPSAEADAGVEVDDSGEVIMPRGTPKTTAAQVHWTEFTGHRLSPLDKQKADAIARRLRDTLVAASNDDARQLVSTGSRLHVGNAASGDDRPFTRSEEVGGVPNMVLVVDMSGSMGGDFIAHAQSFIAAFLRLLRSGEIMGSVWLTGGNKHAHVPKSTNDAALGYLMATKECESVADTLDAIKAHLIGANVAVVYTDADLTDRKVDAAAWRARGVDLIGAVVGGPRRAEAMKRHFGRSVVGATGIDLANKLVAYLATRTAAR